MCGRAVAFICRPRRGLPGGSSNSGDVQLELIRQRSDVPSFYRDFLLAGHEGMQHWLPAGKLQ
jgi:hypothetical protein